MELTPWLALTIGLFSSLHCLGMCGSIISALSFSLPPEVRERRWRLQGFLVAYNLGRISSYAAAGALAGGFGSAVAEGITLENGHLILRVLGALMLMGIGLYLGGWFPRFALLERIGVPLWRRLEPFGRRLVPVTSLPRALLFGMVWGWLPCGLVYSTLLWASTLGSVAQGALSMAAFGAGTFPAVLAAGAMMHWFQRLASHPVARRLVGGILLAVALGTLLFGAPLEREESGGGGRGHQHHLHLPGGAAEGSG
ncbi:MAG TPA: sulfite exporter TauE/SafE family protein [Thiotrichales bacterium]|nr:sulfite exporter TauE/SafE family protein [Thiotrichales bacterium]